MKLVIGVMVVVSLGVLSGTAYAQRMKLGEVLVLNVPDLKPDADTKAFEQHLLTQVTPAWRNLHLVRADRGSRKGQYMLAWTTDTEPRRQGFKSASSGSRLRSRAPDLRQRLDPFVNSGGQKHE